jgi:hypothetical protein
MRSTAAELLGLLSRQGGPQQRPDVVLLVVDVLAPGGDELGEQFLELGITGVELVEHFLALVFPAGAETGTDKPSHVSAPQGSL